MKNTWKKVLAMLLSTTLIVGAGVAYASYADKSDTVDSSKVSEEVNEIISSLKEGEEDVDVFQDETVYVIASNQGEVTKMIVSDKVKDHVNDTEKLTQEEKSAEAPVDIKVTYKLDGSEITPSELAGKSGHVTITYDYVNKEVREVENAGGKKELYVPFAVVTGILLDEKTFTNVSVEGGRVIGDGNRLVAVGIAFPGLKDDLTFDKTKAPDKIEIPENFVVEADVKDFALGNAYTFVTNPALGDKGVDADSITGLLCGLTGQVADAMNSLMDGSVQLKDGIAEAADGANQLRDGAKTVYAGAGRIADGAEAAYDGSKQIAGGLTSAAAGASDLSKGAAQVSAGLTAIDANSAALVAGAGQVFDSLLATANDGLKSAGLELPALTKDNYSAVIDGALAQLDAQAAETTAQYQAAAAAGLVTPKMQAQILAGKQALEAGTAKLNELKTSLDSYNTFYQGIVSYTAGVGQVAAGAGQVSQGAASLNAGLGTLSAGAASLQSGLETLAAGTGSLESGLNDLVNGEEALCDGMTKLEDGSVQLSEGLQKFNDELVAKLLNFLNEDTTELADRLSAIADISNDYKSLNGLNDAEDGTVKFIYKLGDVK